MPFPNNWQYATKMNTFHSRFFDSMYLPFGIIGTDVCLRFHYNVHHQTAGTLQIILDPDGQPKWSAQNTGGVWISHRQTVRLKYGQKVNRFDAVRNRNFLRIRFAFSRK